MYFVQLTRRLYKRPMVHVASNPDEEAIYEGDYRLYCNGQPVNPKHWRLSKALPDNALLCEGCARRLREEGEPS